ncbi:glycogen/starch/alpha-glucan phosphorylase [Desulfurococcaceae archaeon MEX13E-LK6-19]|nr:glycogen/starch/alpha-glucan phosphorylase [Desulfurococcaceae archaeon MEX13E-LK6-19]
MVIVSITPEIALEEFYTYAGGLGVLEGDKFYTASRMGLEYIVLSIFYRRGYVDYIFDGENPVPMPQKQPSKIWRSLVAGEEFTISLRGEDVIVRPWIYERGSAKAVLFEATCPKWARGLTEQVYIDNSIEEQFLRYAFLAKAAAKYMRDYIGLENIDVIDLQESLVALTILALPLENRYRLVIHTPGPWGHPGFPGDLITREFGVFLGDYVVLTEMALERVSKAFTVSKKHMDIMKKVFPRYADKITWVTNGIDIERWMDPELYKYYRENKLDLDTIREVKNKNKDSLEKLVKSYKENASLKDKFVVAWVRRLSRYKRPYFITRFIEENPDIREVFFVLGGKPHPRDSDGLNYARTFRRLHLRLSNIVYIHDYDVGKAKIIFRGSHILLFTPFSGWEACGTSYMKAGVNATPVLSSRDGGAIEVIKDGVNGWLFGIDLREFINIYNDPKAKEIDEKDYNEFKQKLFSILDMYNSDPHKYAEISLEAVKTFTPIVDMTRTLKQYYM